MSVNPPPILGSFQCLPKLASEAKQGRGCHVRVQDWGLSHSPVVLMRLISRQGLSPPRELHVYSHKVGV